MVTIICSKEAGIPIKCYSPELIVYPVIELPEEESRLSVSFMRRVSTKSIDELCEKNERRITPLLSRIDSLVIGPALDAIRSCCPLCEESFAMQLTRRSLS